MKKTVLTTNLIIINDKNQIFLAKRAEVEKHFSWYWSIPGGKVDPWEEVKLALHREIKEELSVNIESCKIFDVYDYKSTEDITVNAIYYIWNINWNIKLDPNELSEWKWFDINKGLITLDFAFNQKDVITDFLNKINEK